jgi:hypothetical protein
MAGGNTPDLSAAAGATECWQRGARFRARHDAWPFTHFTELAEAHYAVFAPGGRNLGTADPDGAVVLSAPPPPDQPTP